MSGVPQPDAEPKRWDLAPESEYRFELDPDQSVAIKVRPLLPTTHYYSPGAQLVKGQAEIFGFELAEGKPYLFGFECKATLFTWRGCTIEMSATLATPRQLVAARHAYPRRTSQATSRRTTSPMRHPCALTRHCTSLSSRCAYARCVRLVARLRLRLHPMRAPQAQTRRACS